MTRKLLLSFFLFFAILFFTACDEDKYADWKILNDNAYAARLDTTDFIKSESGLCYNIIDLGNMKRPNVNSKIKVKYVGRLITGEIFDQGTAEFYLSNTVKGWQEAITKIKVGGSMEMFFPYSLGYGTTASGVIPPYSMLYFKVELLDAQY
jgi:FKBP-type peptidyl-prolyl cis-trans isomerase